jgi:hypothetical protein
MIIIFWEMTPCGSYNYHLPEDDNHHSHRRGNLKYYNTQTVVISLVLQLTVPIFLLQMAADRFGTSVTKI